MKRFAINEVDREGKISISVVADESINHVSTMSESGVVTVERSGNLTKTYTETRCVYEITSELCNEFIMNETLEAEHFELAYTKVPIPKCLRKIKCKNFTCSFIGNQRARDWFQLVDGPIEVLKITDYGKIEGLGRMKQLKRVEKELIVNSCDISDEELKKLNDYGTLLLNSPNITEIGVMEKLQKWLELPVISGNSFELRFIPSSPDYNRNIIFNSLTRAEVTWTQYFAFNIKHTQKTGKVEKFKGFYFFGDQYNLIKILIPSDWNPNIVNGEELEDQ